MATLEKIRSHAVLLVVVVGFALLAFIVGDFLNTGTSFFNSQRENIAVVDGEAIKIQEYQVRADQTLNSYKSPGSSMTEDTNTQIRLNVLDAMVNEILLAESADQLGLSVGDAEMQDLTTGNNISPVLQRMPDFVNQQTGMFDKEQLIGFLQYINTDISGFPAEFQQQIKEVKRNWLQIEKDVERQQLQSKLMALFNASLGVNKLDAQAAYDDNKDNVDFKYVYQSFSAIPDADVTVSDAEVRARYNERKSEYKQNEAKVINFIAVNILPGEKDYQKTLEKMNAAKEKLAATENVASIVSENSDTPYVDAFVSLDAYNGTIQSFIAESAKGDIYGPVLDGQTYYLYKYVDETTAPDSINFNLMSLPLMEEAKFKSMTDSLINEVKTSSFAEVATAGSNGQSDGNFGWATEADLTRQVDASFKDQLFAAKLNEPFVATSPYGSYLVQVTEKTKPVKKYKVASLELAVTPSQETKTALYNELSAYVANNQSLTAFSENATAAGYDVRIANVEKNDIRVEAINNSRAMIQWAFKNNAGAVSDITETTDQQYFMVAIIEGTLKEGVKSYETMEELLRRQLLNEKKAEKFVADLKAKNLSTIEAYAEAMNSPEQSVAYVTFNTAQISGIGTEPAINAAVATTKEGDLIGPAVGKTGVYVLAAAARRSTEAPFDLESQKRQLQMQDGYRRYQWFQTGQLLRENANIENNYYRFY